MLYYLDECEGWGASSSIQPTGNRPKLQTMCGYDGPHDSAVRC